MTTPAGGNELGTVFINVAPKMSGLGNQFLAAGREGAKTFLQGFTEGMKQVALPSDASVLGEVIQGKPIGTATKTASQRAGTEIGKGLNTGIAEGMKTAPSGGGGVLSDVNAGKEIGASINKGITATAEQTGNDAGEKISGGIKAKLQSIDGAAIGATIGGAIGDGLRGSNVTGAIDSINTGLSKTADIAATVGIDMKSWQIPPGVDTEINDISNKTSDVVTHLQQAKTAGDEFGKSSSGGLGGWIDKGATFIGYLEIAKDLFTDIVHINDWLDSHISWLDRLDKGEPIGRWMQQHVLGR